MWSTHREDSEQQLEMWQYHPHGIEAPSWQREQLPPGWLISQVVWQHQSLTSPSFWKSLQFPDFELFRSISAAVSPVPLLSVDLRPSITDPFSRFCLTSLCTTRPVDNQFLKPGSSGSTCPCPWSLFSFLGLCTCSSLLSA